MLRIQQLTHLEQFNLERMLEDEVTRKYGYCSISQQPIFEFASKSVKCQQRKTKLNYQMQPIQTGTIHVEPSNRFKKLIKQLDDYQYKKTVAYKRQTQKQNTQQINDINGLLNHKIRQYNNIIDHKHLKDSFNVISKAAQTKESTELIAEEINKKNQELVKVQNLTDQYNRNKSITKLYKKFRDKMWNDCPKSKTARSARPKEVTLLNTFYKSTELKPTQNKYRRNSHNLTSMTMRLPQQKSTRQMKALSQTVDLKDPFKQKQRIKKGYIFDKQSHQMNSKLKIYQQKVNWTMQQNQQTRYKTSRNIQKRNKRKLDQSRISQQQKLLSERKNQIENSENQGQFIQLTNPIKIIDNSTRIMDFEGYQKINTNIQEQQRLLSSYLSRKNRRFKKPCGNKILVKYDNIGEARSMVQGVSRASMRTTTTVLNQSYCQSNKNSSSKLYRKKQNENVNDESPDEKQIENEALYASIMDYRNDVKHHERMQKNEKTNMFLNTKK